MIIAGRLTALAGGKDMRIICEYTVNGEVCQDKNCILAHPEVKVKVERDEVGSKQMDLSLWIDNWIGGFLIHQHESS